MNLISFSIKTKGILNFARRLWTVFTRFGFSETRTRKALFCLIDSLHAYASAPTFFIPAMVLNRYPRLIKDIATLGAEVGVHGFVHNDFRTLSDYEQFKQTEQAISVFERAGISHRGFRNPYLGWTESSLQIFEELGFLYESNEAVIHEVIDIDHLLPFLRRGYEKSLQLFQAIPCSIYSLRPHFERTLLRIPISIPDDEMLFDRLRMDAGEVERAWSEIMQHIYDLGGLYTLNLHPERGILCKKALDALLTYANTRPLPVWITQLQDVAQWWKERSQFRVHITPQAPPLWKVDVTCTTRATLLGRHVTVQDQPMVKWVEPDSVIQSRTFIVHAECCPCLALSSDTATEVLDFLLEQGYPTTYSTREERHLYALYLDLPDGLGTTRDEQFQHRSQLVQQIEQLEAPFLHFGCWPNNSRSALAISVDIDSVTIQDFFMRILEVH